MRNFVPEIEQLAVLLKNNNKQLIEDIFLSLIYVPVLYSISKVLPEKKDVIKEFKKFK